jgi:TolA-binding protein
MRHAAATLGALSIVMSACGTSGNAMPMRARPTLDYDRYQQAGADPAPAADEQQIATLERQVEAAETGKAALWLRLGALHSASWRQGAGTQGGRNEAVLLKAVQELKRASDDRTFERGDEALYQLGMLLHAARGDAHARDAFHRLIKDHPSSKRVPAAYLYFGEYLFDGGDFKHSREFYERVTTFEDPTVQGFALYKLGWCAIHIGDANEGAAFLNDALRAAHEGHGGNARQSALLAEAAQRDLDRLSGKIAGP